jgi:ABC-type sugar transport system permease subunit
MSVKIKGPVVTAANNFASASRRPRHAVLPYLYVLPAVLMFVVFVLYPIIWVISESLHGNGHLHPT